jgi:hypothetical protein
MARKKSTPDAAVSTFSLDLLPRSLVAATKRDAESDADAVAAVLEKLGFPAPTAGQAPQLLPRSFLLALGVACRLARWEVQRIRIHLDAGLPSAIALMRGVLDAAYRADAPAMNRAAALWTDVLALSSRRLAWDAVPVLAANVVLGDIPQEDALLDALASFAWQNRHRAGRLDNEQAQEAKRRDRRA